MTLRRGFKTEAHAIAREVRDDLGLGVADPLDVMALACHLDIAVRGISVLRPRAREWVDHLLGIGQGNFSAVTIFRGSTREIWHNDSHAPVRQASNLAHELAHALLLHPPGAIHAGGRDWDADQEEEAQWLGGALLVSDESALAIARAGLSDADAAVRYGVSVPLMTWRMAATGARTRAHRIEAKQGRR